MPVPSSCSSPCFDHYFEELGQLRRQLGLDEVVLYGHSWGSILATSYMTTGPRGVKGLIPAGPALSMPRWGRDAAQLVDALDDATRRVIHEAEASGETDSEEYQAAMAVFYGTAKAPHPIRSQKEHAMKTILRIVGGLVALLVLAVLALLVGARFADGPVAIIAGGPFESGEIVTGPEPDWSFVRDIPTVEFQLLEPARSRTTWILYHDGKAYIPSGYMTTWWGKIWKQWPHEVEKDPRILLRIGDDIYERKLVRIQEGPAVAPILSEISRKYLGGTDVPMEVVSSGYLWIYELAPRDRAGGGAPG